MTRSRKRINFMEDDFEQLQELGIMPTEARSKGLKVNSYLEEVSGFSIDGEGKLNIDVADFIIGMIYELVEFLRETRLQGQGKLYLGGHDRLFRYLDKLYELQRNNLNTSIPKEQIINELRNIADNLPTKAKMEYMAKIQQMERMGGFEDPMEQQSDVMWRHEGDDEMKREVRQAKKKKKQRQA